MNNPKSKEDEKLFHNNLKNSRKYLRTFHKQLDRISSMLKTIEEAEFNVSLAEVATFAGFKEEEAENVLGLLGWCYKPETEIWTIEELDSDPCLRIARTIKMKKEES